MALGFVVGEGDARCVDVEVGSRQPHHPGSLQLVEVDIDAVCVAEAGTEVVGGVTVGANVVVVTVTLTSLLHPNQPAETQLAVVNVVVTTGTVELVVLDSSRQPHHPGVLHVVVLVYVVVLVVVDREVVVTSEPLLSKNFQL